MNKTRKCDKCLKELKDTDNFITHVPGWEWRQKVDCFGFCSSFNFCYKCANRRSAKTCVRELMGNIHNLHDHEKHTMIWCQECYEGKCRRCLTPISNGPGLCKDCDYEDKHRWDEDDDE